MIGLLLAAWLDVRSKPLRTAAAIAGMVAAIVAVVLVDAAGVLSRDANDEYLARNYGLPVTVSIGTADGEITPEQAARLEAMLRGNGVKALSPTVGIGITRQQGDTLTLDGATWVSSAYRDIRIVDLVAGSWPIDTARGEVAHAVITEGKARELGFDPPAAAVGQAIWFTHTQGASAGDLKTATLQPMIVDAVAAPTTNAFESGGILIVSDVARPGFLDNRPGGARWLARVNPADYGLLQTLVASVTDERGAPVFDLRRVDQSQELAPVLDQQEVTARAVIAVALAIGGLGILGVGVASVRERRQDFGLRRALGASTAVIFTGVIVQTLIEVLLATVAGIVIAAVLLELFARELVLERLPLPPSTALPVESALLGLAGALIVGLVAGLIPAVSAARASVVQALRA